MDLRFDIAGIYHNFPLAVERILYTPDVLVNGRVLLQSCQASVKQQLIVLIVQFAGLQPSSGSRDLARPYAGDGVDEETGKGVLVTAGLGQEELVVVVPAVVVLGVSLGEEGVVGGGGGGGEEEDVEESGWRDGLVPCIVTPTVHRQVGVDVGYHLQHKT